MPDNVQEILLEWGMKTFYAVIILIVGLYIIKIIMKIIEKGISKSKVDPTIEGFAISFARIGLKIVLLVSVIGVLGLPTTTFAAIIGAAGLALGLSLQGSLSNFAGGILILLIKPFVVGNYIKTSGHSGTVKKITIFYTYLATIDNKVIMIPNGELSNNSVINYSINETRRIDFVFGVGYGSDVDEVKKIIYEVVSKNTLVHNDPEPFVRLSELNDSSLDFTVKIWVNNKDYWIVYYDMIEDIKKSFDENNIEIPYPHMVNVIKNG